MSVLFLFLPVSPLMLQSGLGWKISLLWLWVYSTSEWIIWTSQIQVHSFISQMQCEWIGWFRKHRLPIVITYPNVLSISHHGCSGPQFFRCHFPNTCPELNTDSTDNTCLCRKRVLFYLRCSVNQDEWPVSPCYTCLLSYLPNDTSSISSFTKSSVRISHIFHLVFFFCFHKWSEIIEPDFWPACLKTCQ